MMKTSNKRTLFINLGKKQPYLKHLNLKPIQPTSILAFLDHFGMMWYLKRNTIETR